MQPTISILGKRASASIFCSNLFLKDDRHIAMMTAYGPTQEVRAFSQILCDNDPPQLKIPDHSDRRVRVGGPMRLISKMANGYSGLYILPDPESRLIIGNSQEECFAIYSRMLDQEQFVHRDWYQPLFDMAEELIPEIGNKTIYRHIENVADEVKKLIKYRGVYFPPPTADISVEVQQARQ